jgi:hypothetical protein
MKGERTEKEREIQIKHTSLRKLQPNGDLESPQVHATLLLLHSNLSVKESRFGDALIM